MEMSREEAIGILLTADFPEYYTMGEIKQALNMAIQSLTAISELSKSLKAVNRYDMDEKVLIGFNMAVAIFNKCFGESCALKNEQTGGDLISRQAVIDLIRSMDRNDHIDEYTENVIEHFEKLPSAEKTGSILEDIKAEIEKEIISGDSIDYINGLNMALMIINEKHISGKEEEWKN